MRQVERDLLLHLEAKKQAEAALAEAPRSEGGGKAPGWILALGGFGLLLWKFKAVLVLVLAKLGPTVATMLLSIGAYALDSGLPFAIGLVLLILVHELGHVYRLRRLGISASVPLFIPFLGAFIALKEMPPNEKAEADVALAGPVWGTLAALACLGLLVATGDVLFGRLAWFGFLMNLFNLLPIPPLDGGRAVRAFGPIHWTVGLLLAGAVAWQAGDNLLYLVLSVGVLRLLGSFLRSGEPGMPPRERWTVTLSYFGLAAFLGGMTAFTQALLSGM